MSRSRNISIENIRIDEEIEIVFHCRLCSSIIDKEEATDIFDPDKNISDKIAQCLPIIVTPYDNFSKYICYTCLDQLDLCCDLIFKSIESEKLFKEQYKDELKKQEKANQAINNINEALNNSSTLNPNGPVICDLCGNKKFSNMETFDMHMVSMHDAPQLGHPELVFTENGEPQYECQACKEHFNSETELRTHEKTHLELTCKFCYQFYSTAQRLQRHTCPNSDSLIETPSELKDCMNATYENVFPDDDDVMGVVASHSMANDQDENSAKYECNKCYRRFINAGNLARHAMIHEKHLSCDVCEKKFTTYSSMLKHRRQHGGSTSSDHCQHCNKVFYKHPELVRHLEQVHNIPRSESSPWCCRFCNKRMMTKLSLSIHERIHTGQRPFKCNWCGIGFRSRANLLQHHPVHTGQRKHKCSVCGKAFSRKSFVRTHMRVHTGDRPYACDVCEAKFTQVGDLRRHKKMHDKGK